MALRLTSEELRFHYGHTVVLDGISFELCEQQVASLVGPNGVGKSTLIKCIDHVLAPKAGVVRLDGKSVGDYGRKDLSMRIGYVPQSVSGVFPYSVFDTVLMGRRPHIGWQVRDRDLEVVAQTLQFMGIEHLSDRYFDSLSGGERQKVTIARALAQEPEVILLDEPTSNLDIKHQLEVMDLIRRLVDERSLLAVMAMHDLNLAARYSDTVLMLKGKSIYRSGSPEQVLTAENILETYGVRAQIITSAYARPHIIPLESSNGSVEIPLEAKG